MQWSAVYRPAWDATPEAYAAAGIVAWGRSRRLGRARWPAAGVLVYVGVQHHDPLRWGRPGAPVSRFFASYRHGGHVWLRAYPTMRAALAALAAALAWTAPVIGPAAAGAVGDRRGDGERSRAPGSAGA